ncbi:MAG: molybdopterin-dependent oxidoreductase [Gammaproteobacteria bacterium]|nr:molybdopterin-dependent oxidoreductase [Gammaproteobacteria bacterium]MDH4315276.1 molybdopterin-dependent oxidoreductase [Gammaproteobacteria bacterium]MDH5213958.1 molybdopterin-dependent oxidoreductase [Gammaproteobacteria bacterium]
MGKWTRRAFVTTGILAGGVLAVGVAIRPGNRKLKVAGLVAGEDETLINLWLKLGPDNIVTAIVPHAEMGQGVHTTLAMMLADEMDADWSLVRVLEAPAHPEYANYALAKGYALGDQSFPSWLLPTVDGFFLQATKMMNLQITGGSTSTPTTGLHAMRVAGAAAKAVLLQAAATAWVVPLSELRAHNSVIHHDASNRSAPYAEFALGAAELDAPVLPRLKSTEEFGIMGTNVQKFDIPAKVDGSAQFGIDASLPGMKYATVMAAPVFGTQLETVDTAAIQDMPGVRRIVNLGDAVAVVADGYWQAKQALDRLPVQFTASDAGKREQSDIFQQFSADLDDAIAQGREETDLNKGDARAAIAKADRIVEAEYRVPYLAHAAMEPMNCTAWVHDGVCELWLGTQNPLGFAADVAKAIDFDQENVLVHNQYLGGGFGRRAFSDYAIQAARIAVDSPYPVKLIWSREEDMRHDHYRQASISRFKAALNDAGMPVAWENQFVNKHDPVEAPYIPYGIDNQFIHFAESKTHVPWGFWRSVDHSLHAFFTESFIDEVAVAAGKDPYRYRRDLLSGATRFRDVLDLAASKSEWDRKLAENWGRGIAIHKSFGTIVAQVAEVEVIDGKVRVQRVVCAVDAGFAIHPDGMKAQMESGIAYGLTAALYGDISIGRGAVVQSNFHDYEMLRMNEAPAIETYILNSGEAIGGAGEPGTPAIAPALANAIFDATGKRIRELPVKLHDLRVPGHSAKDVA